MMPVFLSFSIFLFFFNDTATTEIYTLSLHDALPIYTRATTACFFLAPPRLRRWYRSEEHTSELQSRRDLVCRLLLEKKKDIANAKTKAKLVELSRRARVKKAFE